jgi:hypothetical protein
VPWVGPVIEPVWQACTVLHQPQLVRDVQLSQVVLDAQGSKPQLIADQSQTVHDPWAGPTDVPDLQVLSVSHQPHPTREAQSEQVLEDAQGSTAPPPHEEGAYAQPRHVPAAGPLALPLSQV